MNDRESLARVLREGGDSDRGADDQTYWLAEADHLLTSHWLADHVAAAVVAERERIAAVLEDEASHPLISNGVTEFTKAARMTFLSAARIARTQGDPA